MGAEIPELLTYGPSWLVPRQETIGFNCDSLTSSAVSNSTSQQLLEPSDEDEDPHFSKPGYAQFPAAILIPGSSKSRDRSRSRGRTPGGSVPMRGGRKSVVSPVTVFSHEKFFPLSPSHSSEHHRYAVRRRFKQSQTQSFPKMKTKPRAPSAEVHKLQISMFLTDGRTTNVNKLLLYFPEFTVANTRLVNRLMNETGSSLSRSWKYYLAIMAVAEHKNQYFISLLSSSFLDVGRKHSVVTRSRICAEKAPKNCQT